MDDQITRELWLEASAHDVWQAVTAEDWLADETQLELWPGGEARFECADGARTGWVEEARPPGEGGTEGRLAFWWARDGAPASRVEITIDEQSEGTRLHIVEARPLDRLDLMGVPLARIGGRSYGPALAV